MNVETIRDYCLAKDGAEESMPFGETTLVFKVNTKMFLLLSLGNNGPVSFNVKCNPELAEELREKYDAVQPGYHMNKKHWNTVIVDGSVPDGLLKEWIDLSYDLVKGKPKKR